MIILTFVACATRIILSVCEFSFYGASDSVHATTRSLSLSLTHVVYIYRDFLVRRTHIFCRNVSPECSKCRMFNSMSLPDCINSKYHLQIVKCKFRNIPCEFRARCTATYAVLATHVNQMGPLIYSYQHFADYNVKDVVKSKFNVSMSTLRYFCTQIKRMPRLMLAHLKANRFYGCVRHRISRSHLPR